MADTDNLALWGRLGKTDPAHTKKFQRGGGFRGTAIKPIYTTQKMTEEFGPAGKGWGMGEPTFQVVPGSEGQVAVYCTVSLWYRAEGDDKVSAVYGVGGDMVVVKQSSGLRTDDEAFKKAFTDAIGNAMKHLGMSADVHMGLFDDSKYVNEIAAEFADERHPRHVEAEPAPKVLVKDQRLIWGDLRDEIDKCSTVEELATLWISKPFQNDMKKLKDSWQTLLVEHKDGHKADLMGGPVRQRVEPDFSGLEARQ
jgi:hypothetical protein